MLLVILGAGASYDSDRRKSFSTTPPEVRLPLAKDLFSPRFDTIAATFDAVQGILPYLREQSPNVEQALETLIGEQAQYPHRARQLLGATYYIREAIDGAQAQWLQAIPDRLTNFVELVERIERWRVDQNESVIFVTFNYDTLLEMAIHAIVGKEFRNTDHYIAEPMPVFKLHGSIDWWADVSGLGRAGNPPAADWAPSMLGIAIAHQLERVGSIQVRKADQPAGGPVIPALSLPVLTKGDEAFSCPVTHIDALRNSIASATRVLIIGWRGAEGHFYRLWKEAFRAGQPAPSATMVVDVESGISEVTDNLDSSAHWLRQIQEVRSGFSGLLADDELRGFLALG